MYLKNQLNSTENNVFIKNLGSTDHRKKNVPDVKDVSLYIDVLNLYYKNKKMQQCMCSGLNKSKD